MKKKLSELLQSSQKEPENVTSCDDVYINEIVFHKATETAELLCSSEKALDKGRIAYLEDLFKQTMGCRNIKLSVSAPLVNDTVKNVNPYSKDDYLALKGSMNKQTMASEKNESRKKPAEQASLIIGSPFKDKFVDMSSVDSDSGTVILKGEIIAVTKIERRGDKIIFKFDVTDYTGSVTVKSYCVKSEVEYFDKKIRKGIWVKLRGEVNYDRYENGVIINLKDMFEIPVQKRCDNSPEKRVELHLHTKMSAMDAVTPIDKVIEMAAEWGHKALAITDHGVVQAFPEAASVAKKNNIKLIYGIEAYIYDDSSIIVTNPEGQDVESEFVVFDVETTGLDSRKHRIIEIGAVKVFKGEIIGIFSTYVNPNVKIPEKITALTGIRQEDVAEAPDIGKVIADFAGFAGNAVLAAHNASFDMGFVTVAAETVGVHFNNTVLDTLNLSRFLLKDLKNHKLETVAAHLGIAAGNRHRAQDDAKTAATAMTKLFKTLRDEKGIDKLEDLNRKALNIGNSSMFKTDTAHAIILVKNMTGLKNLYRLVSMSHLQYFYKKPRIPKSRLDELREGLILGSACEKGELFNAILSKKSDEEIDRIADYYDYFEIQPLENNRFLIETKELKNEDELKEINKRITELGEKKGKPVAATCDAHFLEARDEVFRRILMSGQGYEDADRQPPLFFRTTEEMLAEFDYLGEHKAYEVVVTNTNLISDMIDPDIKPIPSDARTPKIKGSDEYVFEKANEAAKQMYGEDLPDIVQKRLTKELDSIIKHGYSVMYYIAGKLVEKSLEDGYIVGSRGSVGSSFVATMCGISEVNPLPPHYLCTNCKYSKFIIDGSIGSGYDMPEKNCPNCGATMIREGQDIPYETFLGFDGEKVPDIDLNFSGEYQPTAHKYTEEIFGEGYTFKAGTITGIAEKSAYGYVRKYMEQNNIVASDAEINRLTAGCTGVKKTTGQHPGGIIVIPHGYEIYDFTPIQRPADKPGTDIITTHFDFDYLKESVLKLDLLGHVVPTMIRMLETITGVSVNDIKMPDDKVMGLFQSTEPLGVKPEDIDCQLGVNGLPEMGTGYVKQILLETKPKTVSDLIQISGLSHGTDVWLGNARELIIQKTCDISKVIGTRDSIMVSLMYKGMDPVTSLKIMEDVRKGKGLKDEYVEKMLKYEVPQWYIDSCRKIKYMFPKAHAAAYVISALRLGWYKVYRPEAFYATYFTLRGDDFDTGLMCGGITEVRKNLKDMKKKNSKEFTAKEDGVFTLLEIVLEMNARKFNFVPIDLYESDSVKFLITSCGIRPPFKALKGLGGTAAESIIEARRNGPFKTIDDLMARTKISRSVVEMLKKQGCLDGIPESRQISLF